MKRICTGVLALGLTAGLLIGPASAKDFSDIQGHWGQAAIQRVTDLGLFSGTGEDTFSPEEPMTRGMFVTALGQLANRLGAYQPAASAPAFEDVSQGAYYAPYVAWAYEKQIVSGTAAGTFSPEAQITREQMCTMLVRFLTGCTEYDLGAAQTGGVSFLDRASISDYAAEAVTLCQALGLVSGVAVQEGVEFQPQGAASRSAVAAVFSKLVDAADSWKTQTPEQPPEQPVQPDKPSGGGSGGGTVQDPEPGPDAPTQDEVKQEGEIAGYLQTMVEKYHASSYVETVDKEVKDCMEILMGCIEDALKQREDGQFLSKDFIQAQYAGEVEQVKAGYESLTEEQLTQINNVIVRLEESEHIYAVMDYFGVDYAG